MLHRSAPAKHLLRPSTAYTGLIKGIASLEPFDGSIPAFSASGQDIWLNRQDGFETRPGIVLSAVGAQCGKVFLAHGTPWATVANTASWTVAPNTSAKYAWYLLAQNGFWEKGGAAQPYVKISESLSKRVWIPDLETQLQVAEYLDHETAEIDAMISDLAHVVDLTRSRWHAERDRLVASSSPNTARTRHGKWIPNLQRDWPETAVKRLFQIQLGKMLDEKKFPEGVELLPYIRAANIREGGISLSDLKKMPFTPLEQARFNLKADDILVVEGGSIGLNYVITGDLDGVYFQKTVHRMRPRRDLSSSYYSEVLNSYRKGGVFDILGNKSTIQHLTADKLENLKVPVPPVQEQRLIAQHLQNTRKQADAVISDIKTAMSLIRERRAALITAAVTGQIDVTACHKPAAEQLEDDITQGLHREN